MPASPTPLQASASSASWATATATSHRRHTATGRHAPRPPRLTVCQMAPTSLRFGPRWVRHLHRLGRNGGSDAFGAAAASSQPCKYLLAPRNPAATQTTAGRGGCHHPELCEGHGGTARCAACSRMLFWCTLRCTVMLPNPALPLTLSPLLYTTLQWSSLPFHRPPQPPTPMQCSLSAATMPQALTSPAPWRPGGAAENSKFFGC